MNLRRKLGPLPLWAWLVLAAVGAYVAYRHFRSSGSSIVETTPQPVAAGTATTSAPAPASQGGAIQAGSAQDTGQTTSDLVAALGGQQANLLDAFVAQSQNIGQLAASQLAALQSQTTAGSFQTQTDGYVGSQPGGSNAPTVYYLSPSVTGGTSTPPAASTATVRSAVTKPTRYYTYKSQVPLGPGQTLHFTTGKGYYAA